MQKRDLKSLKLGFIGGGNMAKSIGASLIRKGVLNPKNVWVSAKTERTFPFWKELGVNTTLNNTDVLEHCDTVFLAMKPHMFDDAINAIAGSIRVPFLDKLFVSVILGISLTTLARALRQIAADPRIIRSMPNTPMLVCEGITVYCNMDTRQADLEIVNDLLSYTGIVQSVPESLMNPISGLSGSGPAYAYVIIEALADGAVKMGVPRDMAVKYAAQVLVGAGKMVLETGKHPGQLKDEVCSPGGSTIQGVHAMERGQVRASMANAVEAAVLKAQGVSK